MPLLFSLMGVARRAQTWSSILDLAQIVAQMLRRNDGETLGYDWSDSVEARVLPSQFQFDATAIYDAIKDGRLRGCAFEMIAKQFSLAFAYAEFRRNNVGERIPDESRI
jgi:hypothetical protein